MTEKLDAIVTALHNHGFEGEMERAGMGTMILPSDFVREADEYIPVDLNILVTDHHGEKVGLDEIGDHNAGPNYALEYEGPYEGAGQVLTDYFERIGAPSMEGPDNP